MTVNSQPARDSQDKQHTQLSQPGSAHQLETAVFGPAHTAGVNIKLSRVAFTCEVIYCCRMALQEAVHYVSSLPLSVLGLALLAAILTLRVVANKITFDAPPVFEGLPFIGGLLKFMGVCTRAQFTLEHI